MRSKNKELMINMVKYIETYYQENGIAPSFREIASEFGITSACVSHYLTDLKEKGLIQSSRKPRSLRTSKISGISNKVNYLPVIDTIACGTPLLAEENIEKYLPISTEFLGKGNYFILRASGNSMINAGINDGDYVIVKQQETAGIGQIVVALIENEATLKRYYLDDKRKQVRLHPENEEMKDMFFDKIVIQGIAVKIIKDLV